MSSGEFRGLSVVVLADIEDGDDDDTEHGDVGVRYDRTSKGREGCDIATEGVAGRRG